MRSEVVCDVMFYWVVNTERPNVISTGMPVAMDRK